MSNNNDTTEFVKLCVDNRFEIGTTFPYVIRNCIYAPAECIDGHGYPLVKLSDKIYYKHRLVAMQFIPNPDNKKRVKHINRNRSDYHIENLCWV